MVLLVPPPTPELPLRASCTNSGPSAPGHLMLAQDADSGLLVLEGMSGEWGACRTAQQRQSLGVLFQSGDTQ